MMKKFALMRNKFATTYSGIKYAKNPLERTAFGVVFCHLKTHLMTSFMPVIKLFRASLQTRMKQ